MLVDFYELNGTDACTTKRNFPKNLQRNATPVMKRAAVGNRMISSLFNEDIKKEDLEKEIGAEFQDIEYSTEKTRQMQTHDLFRQILRYVDAEDTSHLYSGVEANVNLGCGLHVKTKPTFIRLHGDEIEVIKVKFSRPNLSWKKARHDLGLYALFCYGKQMVADGETTRIRASYYYMRKTGDSNNRNFPSFEESFFNGDDDSNIIYIVDDYTRSPSAQCPINRDIHGELIRYVKSIPKDECDKDDCDRCDLKALCQYTKAPLKIMQKKANKSLSDLDLTEAQERVVEYESGICRVNAGAGAGKTMVIALRVATLINKGVNPEEIFLVTFTNAGAQEMRSRIQSVLDDFGIETDLSQMTILTFNAFGYRIIKERYTFFDFTDVPQLIDDVEKSRIITDLLEKDPIEGLDYRNFETNMPNCKGALPMAKMIFDIVKKGQYSVSDYIKVAGELGGNISFVGMSELQEVIALYDKYDQKLHEENLIEFADQEVLVSELLHSEPFYLEKFGFKHIIIDEFQDTGAREMDMIRQFVECPAFESLMVVGDDSQSIFEGLKGARPENIINFGRLIGKPIDDIELVENHRSTPEILEAANMINSFRKDRVHKSLIATRSSGKPVIVKGFLAKQEEKDYVVDEIKSRIDTGCVPEDIAVIAATKYELLAMADTLAKENIPTVLLNPEPLCENSRVIAALSLYTALTSDSEKDMLIYANACSSNHDLIHAKKEVVEKAIMEVQEKIDAYRNLDSDADKKAYFLELLRNINENDDEVYESFIETLETKPCMSRILDYCRDFQRFGGNTSVRRNGTYPGVALVTAHSSKGLEWPIVFNMISKYDGPSFHDGSHYRQRVEERKRLLFVSMTRARDELIITGQYVSHGKRGDYTYNQFLWMAYKSVGDEFTAEGVELLRKEKEEKRKRQEKLQS